MLTQLRECLSTHSFRTMFTECIGWERANATIEITVDEKPIVLQAIAEKRGLAVFHCPVHRTSLANRGLLRRIQRALVKCHHEHIVIYASEQPLKQVWQWAVHLEDGRKIRHREHPFLSSKPPDALITRISGLAFSLSEEDDATLSDALNKAKRALDLNPEQELFARFPNYATRSDELAVAMRAGEPGALGAFCEFHFRLARKSSRMLLRWFGMEEDDAFQIACIGLVQAAHRFDPERGNQFSSLASYRGSDPNSVH